jgi:glycosyltransferase involved in cell wall biosynthesis
MYGSMKNKKILFIIKGGSEWIGGLHYTRNLIKTVHGYCEENNIPVSLFLLVYDETQVALFNDVASSLTRIFVYNKDLPPFTLLNRIRWRMSRMRGIFNGRLDAFAIQQQIDFIYPALPRKDFRKYRFAEWIPDFQYRHYPDGSNTEEIEGRIKEFGFISNNAPLIYVSSEHGKKDCEELFPVSRGKIDVMRFCVHADPVQFATPLQTLLDRFHIPRKYFIVSNLLAPTKNLQVVIKAVALLKKQGIDVPVVVTGDIHDYRNPGFKHTIFQLISENNVRENMIMLGLTDRLVQKQLLVNSMAIIQPSRFEGWNTLVEEAKFLNKHIILSDIPVHLEQNPVAGTFFRDNDEHDLAGKLQQAYTAPVPQEETAIGISEQYKKNIREFAAHFMQVSFHKAV